jgi:hypothetical protein
MVNDEACMWSYLTDSWRALGKILKIPGIILGIETES